MTRSPRSTTSRAWACTASRRARWRFIEPGKRLDFPDLILRLIAAGEVVRAWPSEDYWLDIGRHDDYEQAQEEFESVRDRLIPPRASAARAPRCTASTTMLDFGLDSSCSS